MHVSYPIIEQQIRPRIKGDCLFDEQARLKYSTAAGWYRINPVGVVFPRDADDVRQVVLCCSEMEIAVIPRGGGTGLAGQAVGMGIVLDLTRYMNKVRSAEKGFAAVEPGIIVNDLNSHLSPSGTFFPIDPTSGDMCTIGGMIATNAAGWHGVKYGATKNYVESLTVVLADGSIETVDSTPESLKNLRPALSAILANHENDIREAYPNVKKNSSGYNLLDTINTDPYDLRKLIVGSEGTLSVIVGARLKLEDLVPHTIGAVAHFGDYDSTAAATLSALEFHPSALEILDRSFLSYADGLTASRQRFLRNGSAALLYFEFEGNSEVELEATVRDLDSRIRCLTFEILPTKRDRQDFWDLRQRISKRINLEESFAKSSFVEDAAVPVEQLSAYLRGLPEILGRFGISFTAYGHAGVGNIHCGTFLDLKNLDHYKAVDSIAAELNSFVISLGGTLSGEHGDGFVRTPFLERLYGTTVYSLFKQVKNLFDPQNILNPGKIIGPQNVSILHDLDLS